MQIPKTPNLITICSTVSNKTYRQIKGQLSLPNYAFILCTSYKDCIKINDQIINIIWIIDSSSSTISQNTITHCKIIIRTMYNLYQPCITACTWSSWPCCSSILLCCQLWGPPSLFNGHQRNLPWRVKQPKHGGLKNAGYSPPLHPSTPKPSQQV